jgi:hypothetical protein
MNDSLFHFGLKAFATLFVVVDALGGYYEALLDRR